MKRRALLRHLERSGCFCARDDGPHSIWKNPATNQIQPVPRHAEIDSHLCRRICRMLSIAVPPGRSLEPVLATFVAVDVRKRFTPAVLDPCAYP